MTNNKRIIFMGSPLIAKEYLKTLINNEFNIIGVYTQPPRPKDRGMILKKSPVHQEAILHDIPVNHPENFFTKEVVNSFVNYKPDLVVVMAYGKLLPSEILSIPSYGCINIHFSLLPRWRGAAPIEYSLLNGDKKTGVTIFRLINELDAGPILSESTLSIENNLNKEDLYDKLNFVGKKLLIKTITNYFNNDFILKDQNKEGITYAPKISSKQTKINFNDNVINVFNKIRAFSPKPGAWFVYQNERIKIIECEKFNENCRPSTIINNEFCIGCEGGLIKPKIVQRQGKKPMNIGEFLKGFKFSIGHKLNA